jgi:hypothetical protein
VTPQTETTQKTHRRAVRFFWGLLIGATLVSLTGNITHAVLRYIPHVVIQIGAASVPPVALLAAVHGIALAVRAGASGTVYRWAVSAVAAIGAGAFALSFLALRDLMRSIGYGATTAWIFPVLIDTAVAVSTLMLIALGDKPVRRGRTGNASTTAKTPREQPLPQSLRPGTKGQARESAPGGARIPASASVQLNQALTAQVSAQTQVTQVDAEVAQFDANLASELIASGVTTQPLVTVIAVLSSHRGGASINAAAKASGINYRTAQRIVEAAAEHRQQPLVAVG